jgi:hypothetical protein
MIVCCVSTKKQAHALAVPVKSVDHFQGEREDGSMHSPPPRVMASKGTLSDDILDRSVSVSVSSLQCEPNDSFGKWTEMVDPVWRLDRSCKRVDHCGPPRWSETCALGAIFRGLF